MIFGIDISSYQGRGIPDNRHGRGAPGFVVINIRDPDLGDKARECDARGIHWSVYTWAFPGADQRDNLQWSMLTVQQAGLDPHGTYYWLDYEQDGVDPSQIDRFLDARDEHQVAGGLYTYLFKINDVADVLARRSPDLWLAYYPWSNDGRYPDGEEAAAHQWGAKIWQFSSNGNNQPGLDENIVIDEAWWQGHAAVELPKGDDVIYKATSDASDNSDIRTGSMWDNAGTRFLRVDVVPPGAVVREVRGDDIAMVRQEQLLLLAAAAKIVNK